MIETIYTAFTLGILFKNEKLETCTITFELLQLRSCSGGETLNWAKQLQIFVWKNVEKMLVYYKFHIEGGLVQNILITT